MELTDREKKIIVDLINIAWHTGAVRSPEQATELNALKEKVD